MRAHWLLTLAVFLFVVVMGVGVWAQEGAGGEGGGPAQAQGPSLVTTFFPLIAIGFIFYFLLIRPQRKQQKEHEQMLAHIRIGDEVITTGGIYGTVTNLDETVATVRVADKVKIRVVRRQIANLVKQRGEGGES